MNQTAPEIGSAAKPARIAWLDIARGIALIAMASYHLLWDLADFAYLDAAFPATGWPKIYARSIASTFLFLAGVSLVLAHGNGIRWSGFWRRWLMIVAAAALVTIGTWFAMPRGMIFFGILHAMAAASLIGLAFLRVPPLLTGLAAIVAFVAPHVFRHDIFDLPALWWVGLGNATHPSFDYVPLLPWLCPFLLGMAVAGLPGPIAWLRQNAGVEKSKKGWRALMAFLGRHSLVFYLVHQPVLISIVFAVSLIFPAPVEPPEAVYQRNCQADCVTGQDAAFCTRFCGCTLKRLADAKMLVPFQSGAISAGNDARINEIAIECTSESL